MMDRLRRVWEFLTQPHVYWRLFSLVLAIIFWLLAAGDGSLGGTERIITLNVEVHNLPSDLVLLDSPELVKVRVRGLSPILNRGEESIKARIDVAGIKEGSETFGVDVDVPTGIELVSITPRLVSVYTEEVAEVIFPVTLALLGMEHTRTIAAVRPEPQVVTVRGAKSILEQVDHVVAHISPGQGLGDLERAFPVQTLDARGRTISHLEIDPPMVRIEERQRDTTGEEESQ